MQLEPQRLEGTKKMSHKGHGEHREKRVCQTPKYQPETPGLKLRTLGGSKRNDVSQATQLIR
ncbi:MAG: hypothetical protein JKY95_12660 [Planctomycetaceae bacterium]|nr:hypothetical protein [Planctomycetaceae bacterium]